MSRNSAVVGINPPATQQVEGLVVTSTNRKPGSRLSGPNRGHSLSPTAFAAGLIQAQEEERRRIARDLHDVVSQQLAVLVIELGRLSGTDVPLPPPAEAKIRELRELAEDLSEDVRSISHSLHSSTLEHLGLVPAIRSLSRTFERRESIPTTVVVKNPNIHVCSDSALGLYRIAQEALHNVARHAKASRVEVTIAKHRQFVLMKIRDNGVGMPGFGRRRPGIGLRSMQERAELAGGTLSVESSIQHGTAIVVRVPLAA